LSTGERIERTLQAGQHDVTPPRRTDQLGRGRRRDEGSRELDELRERHADRLELHVGPARTKSVACARRACGPVLSCKQVLPGRELLSLADRSRLGRFTKCKHLDRYEPLTSPCDSPNLGADQRPIRLVVARTTPLSTQGRYSSALTPAKVAVRCTNPGIERSGALR
jgi:hypothetical protein